MIKQNFYKSHCDLSNKVSYFPIRHDSPASCFYLKDYIDQYKPDVILVEFATGLEEQINTIFHNFNNKL